jgi:hypothetical protein
MSRAFSESETFGTMMFSATPSSTAPTLAPADEDLELLAMPSGQVCEFVQVCLLVEPLDEVVQPIPVVLHSAGRRVVP